MAGHWISLHLCPLFYRPIFLVLMVALLFFSVVETFIKFEKARKYQANWNILHFLNLKGSIYSIVSYRVWDMHRRRVAREHVKKCKESLGSPLF
jgi:hypothetical protein